MKVFFITVAMLVASLSLPQNSEEQVKQQWCVADTQAPDDVVQGNLDWACKNGADCSKIQPGQPCFLPNTIKDHASFAFNSYYQQNKNSGGSCYFSAAAILTDHDPSHDACQFDYIP